MLAFVMLTRFYANLASYFHPKEILILYGPRRVGKTTLLDTYLKNTDLKYRLETGDNIRLHKVLSSRDLPRIIDYAGGYELIVIDEAQLIPNIGQGLKLMIDNIPNIKIIATGSSSFDLSNQLGEPLTGRKTTLNLFPIAQLEMLLDNANIYDLKQQLPNFLIFGSYPQVVTAPSKNEKVRLLDELVNSYIFKDVLTLENVKGAGVLLSLLKLLAFQIGSEVSLNEISTNLGIDVKTVGRYLDLLEKTFIIKKLTSFSRNLRSEITSKSKYYFLDNGIRNAAISQYNTLEDRNDIGQLWENFIMMERLKKRSYQQIYGQTYFWRTYDQREIDLIEERDGKLFPFEFKWSGKTTISTPKDWLKAYPSSQPLSLITQDNYLDFVT